MRTSTKERKPMSYREGSEKSGKTRDADVEIEIKTGSKKKGPEGEVEEPEKEGPEEEEMDSSAGRRPRGSRKRSAKGAKNTKAPMDAEGSCSCGKKGKACSCGKAMKDAGCGMKKRNDALTAPEYLAACELGIQDRSRTYIRARLDTAHRFDLKCGKGAISQGEKCTKGPAQKVSQKRPVSGRRAAEQLIRTGKVAKGWQVRELNWGERFGWDLSNNFGQAVKNSAKTGALIGGITGAAAGGLPGAAGGALAGGAVGSAFGAVGAPLGAAISATSGYKVSTLERKPRAGKKRRSDSAFAAGFTVDLDQLTI